MMAEWCIQFLVTVCLLLIADLISRSIMSGAYLLYYKLLSSNFLMLRSIPLGGGGGGHSSRSVTFLVLLFLRTVLA